MCSVKPKLTQKKENEYKKIRTKTTVRLQVFFDECLLNTEKCNM